MGGNFIFRASSARSPFGSSYVSGSHCGNKAYWASTGGGISSRTSINIKQYNYGGGCCDGGIFGSGYYGGGCYGHGISDKAALTALGVGAGIGLLASPLGGGIMRGIGTGFKYLGLGFKYAGIGIGKAASWTWNKAIKPAATWTYNNVLKPVGQGIWNGVKAVGQGIGEFFTRCWNGITGKGWTK